MLKQKNNTFLNIGVIGFGYWGPNLARCFNYVGGCKVVSICDLNEDNLSKAGKLYPGISMFTDYREITKSTHIDAVVIATPVYTHFDLALSALKNDKHVFIEKPFTSTSEQAEELIALAAKKNLKIMVDHTFLFTGAVKKIKELIEDDTLGDLCYYDSTRINLGLFQHDVNVVWDLAPHDLSVMDYLIKSKPLALTANGMDHFDRGVENIAYITLYLENNLIAHFNVNWLSPVKIRKTLIGGLKKMLVWNDLEADEKIKVYDKGVDVEANGGLYNLLVAYRSGDMWAPRLSNTEAIKTEAEYFLDCVVNNKPHINDGHAGLRIVRMLEASDRSIKKRGKIIKL